MKNINDFFSRFPLLRKSFARFALSGASSFLLDITLFQIFCSLFRGIFISINYVFFSSIIARIFSPIYNHTVNYRFVFDGKKNYSQSALRYIVLAFIQGFCSATLTAGIFNIVQCDWEMLVKVPVDVALFFLSYVIQKKFVY